MTHIPKLTSPKDLQKIVKQNRWILPDIQKVVREIVSQDPSAILRASESKAYLTTQERSDAAHAILNQSDENQWIRHIWVLMDFIPNDQLRRYIMDLYKKSPWLVQTQLSGYAWIFSAEYFNAMLEKNEDFQDSSYFEMFLLFHAHHDIHSYGDRLRTLLKKKLENADAISAHLFWFREPWFACWGMEKNYLEASNTWNGICIVNGALLAKYFHRKWNAKKVSYLPAKNYMTDNGYVLWENYFYSPSQQQHEQVIEAIEKWVPSIQIEDLSLKSVRPANGISSAMIVARLPEILKNEIK